MPTETPSDDSQPTPSPTDTGTDGAVVHLRVAGQVWTFREGDMTPAVSRKVRQATGLSVLGHVQALQTDPDIDVVAGLVWALRLRHEPDLALADVEAELGWAQLEGVEFVTTDAADGEEGEEGHPET